MLVFSSDSSLMKFQERFLTLCCHFFIINSFKLTASASIHILMIFLTLSSVLPRVLLDIRVHPMYICVLCTVKACEGILRILAPPSPMTPTSENREYFLLCKGRVYWGGFFLGGGTSKLLADGGRGLLKKLVFLVTSL